MLFLALADNPYSYYQILRWVVAGTAGYSAYLAYLQKKTIWVWILAIIAILFNPISSFHFDRETWSMLNVISAIIFFISIFKQKINLDKEYPLIPHTNSGRLFSTVRRMKVERELNIPISDRTGFAISVETGKSANKMTEQEWEKFYKDLSKQLEKDYPELYNQLFLKK